MPVRLETLCFSAEKGAWPRDAPDTFQPLLDTLDSEVGELRKDIDKFKPTEVTSDEALDNVDENGAAINLETFRPR